MKSPQMSFICLFMLASFFSTPVFAGEKATMEECVQKVKMAATLVREIGMEATLEKIQEQSGPFTFKDSYVFGINMAKKTTVVHPLKPELVGKELPDLKDINGKRFFSEFIRVARTQKEGWVTYMWPKPGETQASSKLTYVMKVEGYDILFGAGIYKE